MKRYLYESIYRLALRRGKMAFISGPRQIGKTTLAKNLESEFTVSQYKNWDETEFRRLWGKSPNKVAESFDLAKAGESRLIILDEIHKSKGWKQKLKGIYDHFNQEIRFIVTGSARLNIFKKGSDSLLGRYLNFRLHPLSYGEITGKDSLEPEEWKASLLKKSERKISQEPMERLLKLSGFPEPFLGNDEKILRIWRRTRVEKIIREDLRDLSRLPELSQVEILASLMPSKVGAPLSVQSLREDLEVAHDTVKRWLNYLSELYYFFEIRPWTKSIVRTLKKEPKIYLYDWTEIEDEGFRFENLIAVHLQKACHYWTDTGEGDFQLYYLRNKDKQEIDFLVIKDKKPWLAVEAKLTNTNVDFKVINKLLPVSCPYFQVVLTPGIYRQVAPNCVVCSANRFLSKLP